MPSPNNTPPKAFILNPAELANPVFVKLVEHWEEELGRLRAQNDADLDEIETAKLRGRIAQLKQNLALTTPPPLIEQPPGVVFA